MPEGVTSPRSIEQGKDAGKTFSPETSFATESDATVVTPEGEAVYRSDEKQLSVYRTDNNVGTELDTQL